MNGNRLFCYGTLRDPEVQLALFGRAFDPDPDRLAGYALTAVVIDGASYRGLVESNEAAEPIEGLVLDVSDRELASADAYEDSAHYRRVAVTLESGRQAFVYVSAA